MTTPAVDRFTLQGGAGSKPFGGTVAASAARTADDHFTVPITGDGASLLVFVNVTAHASSPSVVFSILGVDPVSGATYTILASAAVVTEGLTVLQVSPQVLAATNTKANAVLPPVVQVFADHSNTDSITYSIGAVVGA